MASGMYRCVVLIIDKMEMDASEDEDIIMNNGNNKNNNTDNDEQIARRLQEEYYSLSHNNRSSNINGDITDNLPLNCISNIYNTKKSITQRHHNLSEATDSNNNSKFERFKKWIDYNLTCNYINWNDINNGLLSNEFIDQCFLDNEIQHIDIQYNQVKGWLFEYLCKFILIHKYNPSCIYLNHEIPNDLINIPPVDKGIDIIFCYNDDNHNNNNEKWVEVQCKYRSQYENKHIKKEYISDLIHELEIYANYDMHLIMTNVENITPGFEDSNFEWFLAHNLKEDITQQFLQTIITPNNINSNTNTNNNRNTNTNNNRNKRKTARDYQKAAVNSLLRLDKSRMQCIMPCGTGKTFVCLQYVRQIIDKSQYKMKILTLLPSLQLINQMYQEFIKYNGASYKNKTLCICSDMDRVTLTQDEQIDDDNAQQIFNEFMNTFFKVPYTTDKNKIKSFLLSNTNNNNSNNNNNADLMSEDDEDDVY
eukprot:274704_1